ncbi:MAG: hypothetical protein JO063_00205 [Pseudonocardiales bacterium]|nr:hypothetical protein [Pseudonocardiales bacterium]MBV9029653.1 hypothetical protein [Pseudonocardiales bacterium]MBW0008533.1 hypothetical protein [Pseudonocardiales bacterium]
MWRGRRAEVGKICAYAAGAGNLVLLVFGAHTTWTLGLAVVLAPFTLATALHLTTFLACGVLSLVLGNRREQAELLVCAIGAMQPSTAGEEYQETMIAVIRHARPDEARKIRNDLMAAAPRTVLEAWVRRLLRSPQKRPASR